MKKKTLVMMGLAGLVAGSQLYQTKAVLADQEKLKVVTTFYPVYEFTKGVVGKEGDVSMLMKLELSHMTLNPQQKTLKKYKIRKPLFIWMTTWKLGFQK